MTLKRLTTLCSLLVLALWLNVGQSGAAPPQQQTITFSGSELLGNPTDTSITINVVPEADINIYYEYGTTSGVYTGQTPQELATADEPYEVVISGLQPDTEYYYRMQYQVPGEQNGWVIRPEHTFHTARPAGSTYQFVITSDSHVNIALGVLSQWQQALDLIAADDPDFMIDLGDTFAMDNGSTGVTTAAQADAVYLYQRAPDILGRASGSVPMFFAMGNHENEEGWNFDDTNPQPIFSMMARKRYFPLPSPLTDPSFYSANADLVEADDVTPPNSEIIGDDQYREDYYAWTWGDALFVVFDPFQYTMQNPYGAGAGEGSDEVVGGDRWNWTLGLQQHQWLHDTLANSNAKYKFLLAHHMLGGTQNYVRGGAEAAHQFEWGGYEADGTTYGFDTRRPAADGWLDPIRQMMIDYGVTAFFHGHDHQFVYELRDGIVYQLVPAASQNSTNGFNSYTSSPYVQQILPNSGYLRVTVAPDEALVQYVKSTGSNVGQVEYEYTMAPNDVTEPDFTITATANANGSISPSGSVGVVAGDDQSFTITPNSGYQVANVLVDGSSVGAVTSYTFTNVQADHTIEANFVEAPPSGLVTVDGAVSSETADDVSSISFAHTTGTGTNRLMLVGVSWNSNTTEQDITSVTFTPDGGGAAVNLVEVIDQQGASQPRNAAIYRWLAPPSGQGGTVTINFSGSVSSGIVAGAINFAGVNQTTPLGTPAGATDSGTASSVTLTGLNGDELVFDTLFQGASGETQTVTPGANQTEQWNDWIGNTRAAASVEQATGASATMSWTASSSSVWVITAVPINPAPAGTTYQLTMVVDPAGSGTTTPSVGSHTYAENQVVNISATANPGFVFDSWTGDVADPNATSTTVTMDADKTVTANFTLNSYPLSVSKSGTGTGTVTSNPAGIDCGSDCAEDYDYSTLVTLTLTADTGSIFFGWTGPDVTDLSDNGDGTWSITMDAAKDITAIFNEETFTLAYAAGANGSLTGDTSQVVAYGEDGTAVEAVPDTGYAFVDWSDGSTDNPRTDTNVTADISVTANFAAVPETVLGDVNGDDSVNSTDALIILSYDAGLPVSDPVVCGDVNGDTLVDSTDALIILSYDAGLTVPFPVGVAECVAEP